MDHLLSVFDPAGAGPKARITHWQGEDLCHLMIPAHATPLSDIPGRSAQQETTELVAAVAWGPLRAGIGIISLF